MGPLARDNVDSSQGDDMPALLRQTKRQATAALPVVIVVQEIFWRT